MTLKSFLKKLLAHAGYMVRIMPLPPQPEKPVSREDFFAMYFSMLDAGNARFLQIGAHDGRQGDPIHEHVVKYRISGTVVEPQPDAFKALTETYKEHHHVKCVNAAIAEESGVLSFYTVKDAFKTEDNFYPMTRIASLKKDVIRKSLQNKVPAGTDPEEYIEETSVKALSFEELVKTYDIRRIDMLQLDVEGYDYQLLKTFDFARFKPSLINFESMHLSDEDRTACENMLEGWGYSFFRTQSDTCAYRI